MQKWEYLVVHPVPFMDEDETTAYELGQRGWELVAVDNGYAYFKRPVAPTFMLKTETAPAVALDLDIKRALFEAFNK